MVTVTYWQLLALIAPVFILIALGAGLRRWRMMTEQAEAGLLRVQVNVLYPCLILQTVLGNAALRQPANLIWPPLVGFGTIVLGFAVGYYAGRALGLARHYGGQPVIAAQIIIGTTVLGVLVIPLWLRLGLAWAGG